MPDPSAEPAGPGTQPRAELPADPAGPTGPAKPPWWADRAIELVSIGIVVACCIFVLAIQHPGLLLKNTTATGGDTGAHVWWPWFMGHDLLPHLRLAGWSKDFYAGFPAGQFYFPFPAALISFLGVLMPYNVAFKLVTVLGAVLLPVAVYSFGRATKAPRPIPAMLAVSSVWFMCLTDADWRQSALATTTAPANGFDYPTISFHLRVMGGNLASNLAGEFSFSLALALAFFFLAAFARALDRRRHLALPAVLLALTILSHFVVGMFAVVAAVIYVAVRLLGSSREPRARIAGGSLLLGVAIAALTVNAVVCAILAVPIAVACGLYLWDHRRSYAVLAAAVVGVGGMLAAVWWIPLLVRLPYATNMGYEKIVDNPATKGNELIEAYLFPPYYWWLFALGLVAIVVAIVYARQITFVLVAVTATFGVIFWRWPQGSVWNLRFLPFWLLGLFLIAGVGVGELCRAPAAVFRWWEQTRADRAERAAGAHALDAAVEGAMADPDSFAPRPGAPGPKEADDDPRRWQWWFVRGTATAIALLVTIVGLTRTDDHVTRAAGIIPFWATYNYSGYENTKGVGAKSYVEYRKLMDTMGALAPGRALWEPGCQLEKYGTTLSLTLLPYWTKGRITSMEGLYSEAAGTTSFYFVTAADVTETPYNTVRNLQYGNISADFERGVARMKALGVRYYMAHSTTAKAKADADPSLKLVAQVPDLDQKATSTCTALGGWKIYELTGNSLVQPLTYAPVVVTDKPNPSGWSQPDEKWLQTWWSDPANFDRPLVAGGPATWARTTAAQAIAAPKGKALPTVKVTNIHEGEESVSFHVSRVGVPVLVRESDYPSWTAHGAKGPWRASPNFMVVIPTSHDVRLTFELTSVDWAGWAVTAFGVVGTLALAFWRPRRDRWAPPRPEVRAAVAPQPFGPAPGTGEVVDISAARSSDLGQ
ncbi:MAG: hypothetical protein JWL73_2657 [Actinomycetia bacterium]|nr:hypothetical protein [Actinomycetes bacterium]